MISKYAFLRNIMKYQEFVKQVVNCVKDKVDYDSTVVVKPIRRNNDYSSDGLNIVKEDNILSPTVFLDECYDEYLKGRSIGGIVSDITDFYSTHDQKDSLDISYFYNFSDVSTHLAFKIINFERNFELLKDVPYEQYLDFAVVCYCLVSHPVFGTGSILVKNEHLNFWNVSAKKLFETAKKNSCEIQPYRISTAKEELELMISEDMEYPDMYMLTNNYNYYGAACMLYDGVLKQLSNKLGNDLIIFPSSVDEVFIIEKSDIYKIEELKEMVVEINKHFVSKENFLSNNVYSYDKEKDEIIIL